MRRVNVQNVITFVTGRKGCGKSTLVREIMRESRRVAVVDYLGEYGPECGALVFRGLVACVKALERWNAKPRFCLSLRVTDERDALSLVGIVNKMRDVLLVVEEASWLCSPSYLPLELREAVRFGRHQRLSQLYVAQRPVMVNRDITSQADVIVSFQQHGERDVAYLEGSVLADRAQLVRKLRPFEIVVGHAEGEEGKVPRCVRERLAKQRRASAHKPLDSGTDPARE